MRATGSAWGRMTRAALPIVCLATLGFLSSCSVGPNFTRPSVSVNDNWTEIARSELLSPDPVQVAWWTSFNDPTLTQLVALALDGNLSLEAAAVRIVEARAGLNVAQGLRYPQLQALTGQAARIELSDNAPNLAVADRSFADINVGFDAQWEIDFLGPIRARRRGGERGIRGRGGGVRRGCRYRHSRSGACVHPASNGAKQTGDRPGST